MLETHLTLIKKSLESNQINSNPNPGKRFSSSLTYISNCLYLFGGCNDFLNDLHKFSFENCQWTQINSNSNYSRSKCALALVKIFSGGLVCKRFTAVSQIFSRSASDITVF